MWVSGSGAESWACQVTALLAAHRVEAAQCSETQMGASAGVCLGVLDKAWTGSKHRPLLHGPDMNAPEIAAPRTPCP